MARPTTYEDIAKRIEGILSNPRSLYIILTFMLRAPSVPTQFKVRRMENGFQISINKIDTPEIKKKIFTDLKLDCVMRFIRNVLPMAYKLHYLLYDSRTKGWMPSKSPEDYISKCPSYKINHRYLQKCNDDEFERLQKAIQGTLAEMDEFIMPTWSVRPTKPEIIDMARKEIEAVVTGEMKDETYEHITTECNITKFQKIWKKDGALIAMSALLACLRYRVNMNDVLEAWYKFSRKLLEPYESLSLPRAFEKLKTETRCYFAGDSHNFLYDIYMGRGLNCASGSQLAFIMAKRRKIKVVYYAMPDEEHANLILQRNGRLVILESTYGGNPIDDYRELVTDETLASEQVLALTHLVGQMGFDKITLDLTPMFGSVFDGNRIRTFKEFALNSQRPRMLMNGDGAGHAKTLSEYYIQLIYCQNRYFEDRSDLLIRWMKDYFDDKPQDPERAFVETVELISRQLDVGTKKRRNVAMLDELVL